MHSLASKRFQETYSNISTVIYSNVNDDIQIHIPNFEKHVA